MGEKHRREARMRDRGERQGRETSEDSSSLPSLSCSSAHLQLVDNYFAANSFFLKGLNLPQNRIPHHMDIGDIRDSAKLKNTDNTYIRAQLWVLGNDSHTSVTGMRSQLRVPRKDSHLLYLYISICAISTPSLFNWISRETLRTHIIHICKICH